jgi:PAS domain S-box-containing protein
LSDQGERLAALVFLDAGEPTAIRREYERVLDSTPDGIMVIDLNRRVRIFNQSCGLLLGRDPNEVIGTGCVCGEVTSCHAADGTSFHSQLCPALDLFRFGGPPRQEQMLCTNVHGEERWVETTYSPIYDAEGNVEFVIGVMRDIHERKLLEQRLRQSEKLASLGQLTAGIAHEIKNPLGVILSSVELILDENRPPEMRRNAAEFIKDEVQRLDSRLRAFLAFARPQPMMPEPVVLNGLVRRTAEMFQSATMGVDLQLDLEQPETILHVDPDQFQQVLSNLIINATEAMQNEGTIRIRTRSDLDHLLLEIEDDGPGVPEEIRKKVLDPFFTTKAHGTGLGLSIVCQIVSAHQGTVTIGESPSLGGARFRIVLPPGIRSS